MDDEPDTFLTDNDPARLLPFSKRLLPEDPDVIELDRHFMRPSFTDTQADS
jgi:hypothetical protein